MHQGDHKHEWRQKNSEQYAEDEPAESAQEREDRECNGQESKNKHQHLEHL
jgi:hypothetical protein